MSDSSKQVGEGTSMPKQEQAQAPRIDLASDCLPPSNAAVHTGSESYSASPAVRGTRARFDHG